MPVHATRPRHRPLTIIVALALAAMLTLAVAASAGAKTVWLCKPGAKNNPCEISRTATVQNEDGTTSVERSPGVKHPKIDCFYVYPTVSGQKTAIADRTVDPEIRAIAEQQASRFSSVCRVFAPMYRQLTLAGISTKTPTPAESKLGPADVLAAWKEYLAKYNHGRGVVFVGHSQGAFVLKQMLADQVDPNSRLRKKLVSALLIGGNVTVKKGKDVGGQFKHIRACRSAKQTGCVIAYSMFDTQPPANASFGRASAGFGGTAGSSLEVLCTNPANLAGGKGSLKPYARSVAFPGALAIGINIVPDVPTPWASSPKQYTAQCRNAQGAQWLNVTHRPSDPRPAVKALIGAAWGLHLFDVNLAWGNLVDDVRAEAKAFAR